MSLVARASYVMVWRIKSMAIALTFRAFNRNLLDVP
jgi:hypothetical protein